MTPYLKQVYNEQIMTVDSESGEVMDIEVKSHKIVVDNEKSFMQIYYHIEGMLGNLTGHELKVFMYLALSATKENIISSTIYFKKDIADKMNVDGNNTSVQSVSNAISSLAKKKVIVSIGRGSFRISPKYLWKSDSNSRNKVMKYFLEVECVEKGKEEKVKPLTLKQEANKVADFLGWKPDEK